jgi:hypothetical protein
MPKQAIPLGCLTFRQSWNLITMRRYDEQAAAYSNVTNILSSLKHHGMIAQISPILMNQCHFRHELTLGFGKALFPNDHG